MKIEFVIQVEEFTIQITFANGRLNNREMYTHWMKMM